MKYHNNLGRQAGMTLIELTVVLLILISLAGLLMPYVSGFAQKAHDSTNADNLASLNTAMARFITELNVAPDNLESLTNNGGGAGTGSCSGAPAADAIWCGLLDTATLDTVTITGMAVGNPQATSLFQAGISAVNKNSTTTTNKTFESASTAAADIVNPAAGGTFARVACARNGSAAAVTGAACTDALRAQHLADAFGGKAADYETDCYDYFAFGVGDKNQMIGRTMASSPIHFNTNGDQGPLDSYNHYIAVFKVDKADNATTSAISGKACSKYIEPAKFVGAAMVVPQFANSKLFGQAAGISYAYENQKQAAVN